MRARKKMHKKVARNAGSKITVIAPPEELFGIVRNFMCTGNIPVPINCLGRCVCRHCIFPCAKRILSVIHCIHHIQLSDLTRFVQFVGFCIYNAADTLAANLHGFFACALCCNDFRAFTYFMHHRLFAIDCFAFLQRIFCYTGMPVI